MEPDAEVADYMTIFEDNMTRKGYQRVTWPTHLLPRLNATCREAIASLTSEVGTDYDQLKEFLLAADARNVRDAPKTWWMLPKKPECPSAHISVV